MNGSATAMSDRRRGWCPGALTPMESGDGFILRVRPRAGQLPLGTLARLSELACRSGNGTLELTRRANIQIRGVAQPDIAGLQTALRDLGVLDADARAEAVRNVLVTPFADAATHAVATELEAGLSSDERLWNLPPKVLFVVDMAQSAQLEAIPAHVRCEIDGDTALISTGANPASIASRADAARQMLAAAHALLPPHPARQASARASRPPVMLPPQTASAAVGLAAAFGTVTPAMIAPLADYLPLDTIVRFAPWRAIYLDGADAALSATAQRAGWIVDADDPLLAVEACIGTNGCANSRLDTRALARTLAPRLRALGVASLHVSGCSKGCARSAPADLVLVGDGERVGLTRNARADAPPSRWLNPAAAADWTVEALP